MPVVASHLTLLGGALCLNFANTKNWSADEMPYDRLGDYSSFLGWSLQLGLLTQTEADAHFNLAENRSGEVSAVLESAYRLREDTYSVFTAFASGKELPGQALEMINMAWARAMDRKRLAYAGETCRWEWVGKDQSLESPLWQVSESIVELLVSKSLERVKSCGGCGWLFLDTTRDGRRRWCDMKLCGNRAKARRHYEKNRALANNSL
jgi:predicted RNA-binding Zn ribbon-like protein